MPRKRPAKATPALNGDALDKLLRLIISGMGEAALRAAAAEKLHLKPAAIDAHLAEARRQITLAADYNRDDELGKSISRLNDCYQVARAIADIKTALACQRELNRLLRLNQPIGPAEPAEKGEDPELAAVRGYLAPLFDAGDREPAHELARLAAAEITGHRGRKP